MNADHRRIFELKMEIRKLLRERPELRPLQEEIDRRMEGAGSRHNRLVLINSMMMDSLGRLTRALEALR